MKSIQTLMFAVLLISAQLFAVGHFKGKQKGVVLLVEWKNVPANASPAEINDVFFSDGPSSARQFFKENSAGSFDLSGTVLNWRKSNKTWDPAKGCSLSPILSEAWSLFGSDLKISDYDEDRNGKIDNLYIVHSGRISQERVGPECIFTDHSKADHTIIFQAKGSGPVGDELAIGFYIHEAGHKYFGFPDLYADHFHGKYGIGMWGMMGLGAWGTYNQMPLAHMFRYSSHFEPLSKIKIGWVKPRVINSSQKKIVLKPVEGTGDIVSIPAGSGTNYYLEYRSKSGFSTNHQGHGLLIWKNYALVQADGRDDINHGTNLGHRPVPPTTENFGDSSDPFPGSLNISSYKTSGFKVENITQYEDRVEFDVQFNRGEEGKAYTEPSVDTFDGIERL